MKKVISVLAAILILSLSVIPAFAESVNSPSPTKGNYSVTIVPSEGGTATYTYDTGVDEDGFQTVTIHAVPNDGYKFIGWSIDGAVPRGGNPDDPDLTFRIGDDIKVTPKFEKVGTPDDGSKDGTDKGEKGDSGKTDGNNGSKGNKGSYVDNGSKYPQTGSDDAVTFVVHSVVALTLASAVVVAKKTSKK